MPTATTSTCRPRTGRTRARWRMHAATTRGDAVADVPVDTAARADHDVAVLRQARFLRACRRRAPAAGRSTRCRWPTSCATRSCIRRIRSSKDIKLVTFGFSPHARHAGRAGVPFQVPRRRETPGARRSSEQDWVGTYHRLLCDAVASILRGDACAMAAAERRQGFHLARDRRRRRAAGHHVHHLPGRPRGERGRVGAAGRAHLGLRHEALVCDPGRAYDRYLAIAARACRC